MQCIKTNLPVDLPLGFSVIGLGLVVETEK